MKKFKIVLPVMIIVFIFAIRVLDQNYGSAISIQIRTLISLGGALFSGLITYFLFPSNENQKN
ncbi:histidine kinase [Bacillus sp. AFS040349]|nr:histidine kinase [Bacillus sp. AFS040349]